MSVRILLVDDHRVVRAGFRELLEDQEAFEVIGETGSGAESIKLAHEHDPDVVLMDIELRGSEMTGIQATRKIRAANPDIKIIALSVFADVQHVKAMVAAGAKGYLSKACSEDELTAAICSVMDGKNAFSEEISAAMRDEFVQQIRNPTNSNPNDLSNRELEVLRLTALGHNAKSIADKLGIAAKTVDAHKRNIMDKLKLYSVAELTKYAIREKIIHADE